MLTLDDDWKIEKLVQTVELKLTWTPVYLVDLKRWTWFTFEWRKDVSVVWEKKKRYHWYRNCPKSTQTNAEVPKAR